MHTAGELNDLLNLIISQIEDETKNSVQSTPAKPGCCINNKKKTPFLTPQKVLVILALLGGALEVKSVLLDRDQTVQVLLDGTLKRKSRLEKMLDEIGAMPFDDVVKAILGRL